MKLSKQYLNFHSLGLRLQPVDQSENKARKFNWIEGQRWIKGFNNMGQWLLDRLAGKQELKVWQTSDCQGNTCWHAYDPTTGEAIIQDSEAEMLCWIEQHYYTASDYAQQQYQTQLLFQR